MTWTVSGFIDRFEVTYSYTVNRCSAPQGAPRTDTISDGSMRIHTLTNLNEDSRYTITVKSINGLGSTMTPIVTNTLTSAPSGIPESISFSDVNLTSVVIQWTELPCSDRNGVITGYTVEYSSTTPLPHINTVTVSGSNNTRLVVGGLQSHTSYTFSVRAQGAATAKSKIWFTAALSGNSGGSSVPLSALIGSIVGITLLATIVIVTIVLLMYRKRRAKAEQTTEVHIYDAISQQCFRATDKKADQLYCEIAAPAGFSMHKCTAYEPTRVTVGEGAEADQVGLYDSVIL